MKPKVDVIKANKILTGDHRRAPNEFEREKMLAFLSDPWIKHVLDTKGKKVYDDFEMPDRIDDAERKARLEREEERLRLEKDRQRVEREQQAIRAPLMGCDINGV